MLFTCRFKTRSSGAVAIKVPIETVLLVAGDKETGEGKACSEPTREKDRGNEVSV